MPGAAVSHFTTGDADTLYNEPKAAPPHRAMTTSFGTPEACVLNLGVLVSFEELSWKHPLGLPGRRY